MAAYQKLMPFAEQLEQTAQQIGIGVFASNALATIKQGHLPLAVRVIIYGVPNETEQEWLTSYLGQTPPSVWTLPEGEARMGVALNEPVDILYWEAFSNRHELPIYAVAFITEAVAAVLPDIENHILMAFAGTPIVSIFFSTPSVKPAKNVIDVLAKEVIGLKVQPLTLGASLEKDGQFLLADRRVKDDMISFIGLSFLKKTEETLAQKQTKTQEHFTALKLQRQQDLAATQKKTSTMSAWQTSREVVNNHKTQYDKRVSKALEEDFLPPQGKVYLKITNLVESLDYLDEQKLAKSMVLVIPEVFMEELKTLIRTSFTEYTEDFLKESRISAHFIEREIHQFFENQNLSVSPIRAEPATEGDVKRLIDRILVFERPFEYAMPTKKITEYMMGARMYLMMLMMGASMLGLSSVFNKERKTIMPLIILIVGFGIYKMVTQKTAEDGEKIDKQLNTAKELLKNETKRQMEAFMRGWQKLMDERHNEPVQTYIRDAEKQISDRDSPMGKSSVNDDKARIQATLNSMTAQERGSSDMQRNLATYTMNVQRTRIELTNSIRLYLQKWT